MLWRRTVIISAAQALLWLLVMALPVTAAECYRWTYDYLKPPRNPPPKKGYCSGENQDQTCYWDSPQVACDSLVQQLTDASQEDLRYSVVSVEPNPYQEDYYICKYTWKGSSSKPYEDAIRFEIIQSQPHCALDVQGPYRGCSDKWFLNYMFFPTDSGLMKKKVSRWIDWRPRGAEFTQRQKNKIRRLNKNRHGQLRSDLAGLYSGEPCTELKDPSVEPYHDCTAEVHHVVPRKEKDTGCPCGRNSYKNALVISRKLNSMLTNDPRPQALLDALPQIEPYPCQVKNIPPGLRALEALDLGLEADD